MSFFGGGGDRGIFGGKGLILGGPIFRILEHF